MVSLISDLGIKRSINEDFACFLETKDFNIYIVADGMGGHNAGEVASKAAAEGIVEYIKENIGNQSQNDLLIKAIEKVNKDIYDMSKVNKNYSGMGTTITACFQIGSNITIANVGDSSCFGFKNINLCKLTKDHSLVQELVDLGTISEQEAVNHPKKNIITRAVGTSEDIKVDIFTKKIDEYDIFLICSDGLTNEVSKDDIASTINESDDLECACKKLVEQAKENGGNDNITVLLFGGEI